VAQAETILRLAKAVAQAVAVVLVAQVVPPQQTLVAQAATVETFLAGLRAQPITQVQAAVAQVHQLLVRLVMVESLD
jgi:hypothetical protein